jgi:hypothetical protein
MENHHASLLKKAAKPARKNSKPERELVQIPCINWMRSRGWSVDVYEAKATFDPRSGSYRQQAMKAGTTDCMGCDNVGNSVVIEFKAPGRRSSFNSEKRFLQKKFLLEKLNLGCFAVVVDDVLELERIYFHWLSLASREARIAYLMGELP